MRVVAVMARILLGLSGVTALVLGISFWTGHAMELLPVHILAGLVLVLSLWTLAALAARAGAPPGLVGGRSPAAQRRLDGGQRRVHGGPYGGH